MLVKKPTLLENMIRKYYMSLEQVDGRVVPLDGMQVVLQTPIFDTPLPIDQVRTVITLNLLRSNPDNLQYLTPDGRIDFSNPAVQACIIYAENWKDLTKHPGSELSVTEAHPITISPGRRSYALPNPTVVPNASGEEISDTSEMNQQWPDDPSFGWDQISHVLALLATGKQEDRQLAIGILLNDLYVIDKLGYVPNATEIRLDGRPHPPGVAAIGKAIFQTSERGPEDFSLLERTLHAAEIEHEMWRSNWFIADPTTNLSRYVGFDVEADTYGSEAASGRDSSVTARGRQHDFGDVMLNAMLYQNLEIMAEMAKELAKYHSARGNNKLGESYKQKQALWHAEAENHRDNRIQPYLWDSDKGFYLNWDRKKGKHDPSLALWAFTMMEAGVPTAEQAEQMVGNLTKFQEAYGLAVTARESMPNPEQIQQVVDLIESLDSIEGFAETFIELTKRGQWDWPHDWANIGLRLVTGLINYGYTDIAIDIMENSMCNYVRFLEQEKRLPEKLNTLTGKNGHSGQYHDQAQGVSFGLTKATVSIYARILYHYYTTGELLTFPPVGEDILN